MTAPCLVVAGLSGDAGKTLVSLALLLALGDRLPVRAFKKGPDYIDAAWLTWASGAAARNLDTFLMGEAGVASSFARHAVADGVNLVEGNRGLYDGAGADGTHSTAVLAKTLDAPVLLVVDATKATRTLAACVLGCQAFDPEVRIAGVVLNRIAGERHERVAREAIEAVCRVPVIGALPRTDGEPLLPGRHLGLVTPHERAGLQLLGDRLRRLAVERLDLDRIETLARGAGARGEEPCQPGSGGEPPLARREPSGPEVSIGVVEDSAFCFYYPENLEALEARGARLVRVSALGDARLPPVIDALYIGGGFPETHVERLSANRSFLDDVARMAREGLPIYAECGGLMLLSQRITGAPHPPGSPEAADGAGELRYPMAGVLPFDVQMRRRPEGHGYVELLVEHENPFFAVGTRLAGHEFHYSRLAAASAAPTACAVLRGVGCGSGRDGIIVGNTWASYTHLHAAATPGWAEGMMAAARKRRASR